MLNKHRSLDLGATVLFELFSSFFPSLSEAWHRHKFFSRSLTAKKIQKQRKNLPASEKEQVSCSWCIERISRKKKFMIHCDHDSVITIGFFTWIFLHFQILDSILFLEFIRQDGITSSFSWGFYGKNRFYVWCSETHMTRETRIVMLPTRKIKY